MGDLVDATRAAQSITDFDEYVRQIQQATIHTLEEADPRVKITKTGFFNHVAIPDFELTWPGSRATRQLFIRRTYSELDSHEAVGSGSSYGDEVHLALAPNESQHLDEPALTHIASRLESNPDSRLVTDGYALEKINSRTLVNDSPLSSMLTGNVLRHARGLVSAQVAEEVRAADDLSAVSLARQIFTESFSNEFLEASELIRIALDPDAEIPSDFEHFSAEQLRAFLPWLLKNDGTRKDKWFWNLVAQNMQLKDLEEMRDELIGARLDPLMEVASNSWTAARAYSGIAPSFDDDSDDDYPHWEIHGKNVSLRRGAKLIRIASLGTSLKAQGSTSSVAWESLSGDLGEVRVERVQLDGIARTVVLDANKSTDVAGDASLITGSLEDTYLVNSITVGFGVRDENRNVEVNFGDSLAINVGTARISDLVRALATLASHENGSDWIR